MKKKQNNNSNKIVDKEDISLGLAFKTLLVIALAVVLLILLAIFLNKKREAKVIYDYTTETKQLISDNQVEFDRFYTETFEKCNAFLDSQPAKDLSKPNIKPSSVICPEAISQLEAMQVDKLKDSSSIAYVIFYENNLYQRIEASGKINRKGLLEISPVRISSEANKPSLLTLYQSRTEQPEWESYTYYIGGKEVPVPMKINNKVVGYIFRGVVEK